MHKTLRDIHLLAGVFSLAFLLMYGVSAAVMTHRHWFQAAPRVSERTLTLESRPGEARAAALELMERHGLRGELQQVRPAQDSIRFRLYGMGQSHEVAYSPATGEARIRTQEVPHAMLLVRIHHAAGLWHDYWLLNAWGALVALASAALAALAATGIYLWFKIRRERLAGALLLAAHFAFTLALVWMMRTAG